MLDAEVHNTKWIYKKKSIVKRNHLSSNLETNKKLGIELAS